MRDKALATSMLIDYVRAETIINLGSMLFTSNSMPDVLDEVVEDDVADILEVLGVETSDNEDIEDVREALINTDKHGWLVLFATPVPKFQEDGSCTFVWGPYVNTQWFYGEDFDALCNRALNWKHELLAERRARWELSLLG